MQTLSEETWQRMSFGEVQAHGALAVLPISADLPTGPEYLTLSEALASGTLVITEVSEGGSIPELVVTNSGDTPVLLLDGEELAGAKQNRVMNTTILLKEQSKTVIPVSCVEKGRWQYASPEFQDSGNVLAANLRARKNRAVSESLASFGQHASDQSDVWSGVAEMSNYFKVSSDTSAMRDVYAHVEDELTTLLRTFTPIPGQRGFAAFIAGKIAGIEYLSQPRAFGKVFEKLLRSYALDALRTLEPTEVTIDSEQARKLFTAIASSNVSTYPALGYGSEHRIDGTGIQGSTLTINDTLLHLSLLVITPRKTNSEQADIYAL